MKVVNGKMVGGDLDGQEVYQALRHDPDTGEWVAVDDCEDDEVVVVDYGPYEAEERSLLTSRDNESSSGYYTITSGGPDSGHYDNFDDALAAALEAALEQATEQDIDPDTVDTFVNGHPGPWPNNSDRTWEAGAGPEGDPCAHWPHVEWREENP